MKYVFLLIFCWLVPFSKVPHGGKKGYVLCTFAPGPLDPIVLASSTAASEYYQATVAKMFAYSGLKDGIAVSKSPDVDIAATGYDDNLKPVIVINEAVLNADSEPKRISIIAHEMGHYLDRHADMDDPVTRKEELEADTFNGNWCSRTTNLTLPAILAAYQGVRADQVHPPEVERALAVTEGFQNGKRKLNFFVGPNLETQLHSGIDTTLRFSITVDPKFYYHRERKEYNVWLHVVPISKIFSADTIISQISFVRYVLDPTFSEPLVTVDNGKTGYSYLLTGVWGDFPVTAVIRYKDGSEKSITETVPFPGGDNDQSKK